MWFFRKKKKTQDAEPPPERPRLLSYQSASLQGLGSRRRQEDGFLLINEADVVKMQSEGLFAAVADGMGGMSSGEAASGAVIDGLREHFTALDREGDLPAQLRAGIFEINEKVAGMLGGQGGSTLVECLIYKEKLYFNSVGDSYVYLKRGTTLTRLNREHNCRSDYYLELIRQGICEKTVGEIPEANALTQYIGYPELSEIDGLKRPLSLTAGDILLLCSDGVGGVLDEASLLECLSYTQPERMCADMRQRIEAQARPHQDNFTALVLRCAY